MESNPQTPSQYVEWAIVAELRHHKASERHRNAKSETIVGQAFGGRNDCSRESIWSECSVRLIHSYKTLRQRCQFPDAYRAIG